MQRRHGSWTSISRALESESKTIVRLPVNAGIKTHHRDGAKKYLVERFAQEIAVLLGPSMDYAPASVITIFTEMLSTQNIQRLITKPVV